jgi:hypothetical protein
LRIAAGLGGFLIGGCASLAETGGRVLDGSAFAEKTLASYREAPKSGTRADLLRRKDGSEFIAISVDSMPNLRLIGTVPAGDGGFALTALEFLAPNLSGWNQFTLDLSGTGSFPISNGVRMRATLQIAGPLETLDISGGKIRRGSSRLNGAQALTALRNRRERILALTQWMNRTVAREQPGFSGEAPPQFADQKGFAEYWEPRLFPELARPKNRPAAWAAASAAEGAWALGEDVKWSVAYTEAAFPEELWAVRNSGTLLRDWEEAAAWIYLEFEWDTIVEFLSGKNELSKIK